MAFLASSAWRTGKTCSALLLGNREEAHVRLRVGDHEQFGKPVGVVAGVVGQDVRRQRMFVSERSLSWKIVASGAVSLPRTGRRASIQGPRQEALTDTNACATLPPTTSHLGVIRGVARQGAGGWKQTGITRLR